MADATYQFLSFVRSGFAASITDPDSLGSGQRALATAPVGVTVSGVAQPAANSAITTQHPSLCRTIAPWLSRHASGGHHRSPAGH